MLALLLIAVAFGQATPPPATTAADILWKKLENRVDETINRSDGVIGAAILDLTDGRLIARNAEKIFSTASSIKLAILLELYRQDQDARAGAAGKARLTDIYTFNSKDVIDDSTIMMGLTPGVTSLTNRDLAQFMIAVSDNAATNVLIDRVGKDNVNATLRSLGLIRTMLRRKMLDIAAARRGDENVATPHEMVQLLDALYREKALNKETTREFFKQLSTAKPGYLRLLLPQGVQLANKPGDLDGVRTDSGIVFASGRPFAISVMTAWVRDEQAAELAIAQISREAYLYFEMRGKTSEYGRVLPP